MTSNSDRVVQGEELEVLKSIFYKEEFQVWKADSESDIGVTFWAYQTLPDGFRIKYLENLESREASYVNVKHIPPIELQLILPEHYPSLQAPKFTICCQWLTRDFMTELCKKLDKLWLENEFMEIIFVWCDFLKSESLMYLGMGSELDITQLHKNHLEFCSYKDARKQRSRKKHVPSKQRNEVPDVGQPQSVVQNVSLDLGKCEGNEKNSRRCEQSRRRRKTAEMTYWMQAKKQTRKAAVDRRTVISLPLRVSPLQFLERYDREREHIEFLKECFTCSVCFTDKLGKDCMKFIGCGHAFCKACIGEYLAVRIKEGTVLTIRCPYDKCCSEIQPSQVQDLVSPELFARYDSVLLNTALDTLKDIVYCPRSKCQYPVTWNPDENLATCPQCQFAFCICCKAGYHGIEPCRMKAEERQKIVDAYQKADPAKRLELELRYGKRNLEYFVNTSMTESWIKDNSKACPHCSTNIEKSEGCNKMVCLKCNTYFCWLCEMELDHANPYQHYSDPSSKCANKLFYLVHVEEEEDWEDWDWVDVSEESDSSDLDMNEPDTDSEVYD